VYSQEDASALHRYKADESYLIGEGKKPIDAYLDIEGIITLAKSTGVDAIHPGYGFLYENIELAKRCEEEGIIFIGPTSTHLDMFGDKVKAKAQAIDAGLPIIPGSNGPVSSISEVESFANEHGYPIIIKASLGGGGRGMRIVNHESELTDAYDRARSDLTSTHLDMFGDKVKAKAQAIDAGLPIIPGSNGPVSSISEVESFANEHGYPIIIKASLGGGGRGMRIVNHESELTDAYDRAR